MDIKAFVLSYKLYVIVIYYTTDGMLPLITLLAQKRSAAIDRYKKNTQTTAKVGEKRVNEINYVRRYG